MSMRRIIKILSLVLAVVLFISASQHYVFNIDRPDILRIEGFRKEKNNSLDVILLGSSEIYADFSSAYAYGQFGFTSYPYSVASAPVTLWKTMLEDALAHQHNPQLIVVETNGAVYYSDNKLHANAPMHYVIDEMPLGKNKLQAIFKVLTDYNESKASFLFPIIKNHSNWQDINALNNVYKNTIALERQGFALLRGAVQMPAIARPEEEIRNIKNDFSEVAMNEEVEASFRCFLDYCREKKLNVLFVGFPHQITVKDDWVYQNYQRTNAIENFVKNNGFPYLNMERLVDEIGIDPEHDFYNESHLNIYGQKKLTEYLSTYIIEHYKLIPKDLEQTQKSEWEASADAYSRFYQYIEKQIANGAKKEISETAELIDALESLQAS